MHSTAGFGGGLALVLSILLAFSGAAGAQLPDFDADGSPKAPAGPAVLRRVSSVCKTEIVRFCPNLPSTATPRNQATCLKYFKPDLSLGCRGAVDAASH